MFIGGCSAIFLLNVLEIVDQGENIDVIYLDFMKAFNKVPHKGFHGFNEKWWHWLSSSWLDWMLPYGQKAKDHCKWLDL